MPANMSIKQRTKITQDIASLGKLELLIDANDVARFYADGASVTIAADLSGLGRDCSAAGTTRPTLVANADGNNNASLRFVTASQQRLNSPSFALSQKMSAFAVVRLTTSGNFSILGHASGSNTFQIGTTAGGQVYGYAGSVLYDGAYSTGQIYILVATFNGASSVVTSNGTATSGNIGSSGITTGISLGSVIGLEFLNGEIFMAGLFSGALSAYRRKRLEQILSVRFQKSITL